MLVDIYLLYQFLRRLTKPFKEWKAFELGIIDAEGNVLRKRNTLKDDEKKAWGYFDIMIANLKKLLAKVPGGSSRLATFAAALMLLREHENHQKGLPLSEDVTIDDLMNEMRIVKLCLAEDAPTNAVGSGAIAGTGSDIASMKFPSSAIKKYKATTKRRKVSGQHSSNNS